ncbi:MAG: flippase-like domain-containing protein [Paludibacteraceae bacterium]|nr:flippase-like domain-containing protein [Paludibacteraceae bacterium]
MPKKVIYHIVEWVIALTACGWLVWKLATYDDYGSLLASLHAMGWRQWLAIGVCVALMPVNMALEAWRWRTLMHELTFKEAQRQVYYSKLAGLITPWRLGEYPARGVLMSEGVWSRVLSMGAVGSATMTMAIIIAGVLGLAFSPSILPYLGGSYLYALGAVILVLAVLFALAPKLLRKWAEVNHDLMLRSIGQSLVRLACWCVQLALVLYALGSVGDPFSVFSLPVYYLLVTVTPSVPIAEVGVRGAWAIVVFGSVNAALAGVLLWGINTLLPCLIWPFLRKNE